MQRQEGETHEIGEKLPAWGVFPLLLSRRLGDPFLESTPLTLRVPFWMAVRRKPMVAVTGCVSSPPEPSGLDDTER